jgi:gluconolactonase
MPRIARFDFWNVYGFPSIRALHDENDMTKRDNPLKGWRVDRDQIRFRGADLQRPECILAERDGTLWSADARGIMRLAPDGSQELIRQKGVADRNMDASSLILGGSLPNGIALIGTATS